ncbi:TPA: hypothetical protein DF272_01540 [Candidatus Falkowbacteria bacterium]|nr:hypothetical protein [Candidatus Falkowbacteria bacterium]
MPFREYQSDSVNIGVGIDLVDSCNIKCPQCFYAKHQSGQSRLDRRALRPIMEKTRQAGFTEFYILGGEPTLHPDLLGVVQDALSIFPVVILVTNGLKFADSRFCRRLAQPRLALAMHRLAMKAEGADIVNQLSGSKTAYDRYQKAWRNIEKYWQGDVNVQLNLMRPLIDGGHVLDVFKWARSMGYEPIMELTKAGRRYPRGNPLDVSPAEIINLFAELKRYDEEHYPDKVAGTQVPPSYNHNCTLIETGIHILINGDVLPCVGHPGLKLGNVFSDDLDDILNHPLRRALMDYHSWIVGPCQACAQFDFCHGGCRGEAYWQTGCPRASDPYCWLSPPSSDLSVFRPESCVGCILEHHPSCGFKK